MLVCVECGSELQCIKTGMNVFVDKWTTYRGDTFQCMTCGFRIVKANDQNEHHSVPPKVEVFDVLHRQARTEGGMD